MPSQQLKADEVRNAEFVTVRLTAGYDMYEVDKLLDRLATTLTSHEYGVTGDLMTADELESAGITQTKLREGYRIRDVDLLLDHAIATLRAYEATATGYPISGQHSTQPVPPPSSTNSASTRDYTAQQSVVGAPPMPPSASSTPMSDPPPNTAASAPNPGTGTAAAHSPTAHPQGVALADFIRQLMELHKAQPLGSEDLPVLVRALDGRTYTIGGVISSVDGPMITLKE